MEKSKFSELFNQYRLKSQTETLTEFGNLLSREGFVYEDSLFSKWKNGERIPRQRKVILAIIRIFIRNKGISTVEEADALLQSASLRDLTKKESEELFNNTNYLQKYIGTSYSKKEELLTQEEAITLAHKFLGKPYVFCNVAKVKSIVYLSNYLPRLIIQTFTYLEQHPDKIDDIIFHLQTEKNIIRDRLKYYSYKKYIQKNTYSFTRQKVAGRSLYKTRSDDKEKQSSYIKKFIYMS